MTWNQLQQRIQSQIKPDHRGILKCRGNERRAIVSNNGQKIVMIKGKITRQSASISYEMIRYAFAIIIKSKKFDSKDFRAKFPKKYASADCRYSMTGGVLVEMGVGIRVKSGNGCYYELAKFANESDNQQIQDTEKSRVGIGIGTS
jgi:hypothetical protein